MTVFMLHKWACMRLIILVDNVAHTKDARVVSLDCIFLNFSFPGKCSYDCFSSKIFIFIFKIFCPLSCWVVIIFRSSNKSLVILPKHHLQFHYFLIEIRDLSSLMVQIRVSTACLPEFCLFSLLIVTVTLSSLKDPTMQQSNLSLVLAGNDGSYILHVGSIKKGGRVLHGKCF